MSIGERLVALRKSITPKVNQAEFGATLGLSRAAYKNYENNSVTPSDAVLKLVCLTYSVNWSWLKYGNGEMKDPPDASDEMVNRIMEGQDDFKKSVFRAFAHLGDAEWLVLKNLVQAIKCETQATSETEDDAIRREIASSLQKQQSDKTSNMG